MIFDNRKKSFLVLAPIDPYFLAILSELIIRLAKKYPSYLIIVVPVWGIKFARQRRSFALPLILKSLKEFLSYYKREFLLNFDLQNQLSNHGLQKFPKNVVLINSISGRLAKFTHFPSRSEISCFRSQLEAYEIGGIKAGDIIIDTFLRFKPSASFQADDPFVSELVSLSHLYYKFFKSLFNKYHVSAVFGSYTSYIQHGIPLRLTQFNGVESFTFGAASTFYRHHKPNSFLSHSADHTQYSLFNHKIRPSNLKLAEASLQNRIYGRKDITISYMQKFSTEYSVDTSVAGKHILFLHDFFDSPHIYRWMLHRDFFHWITDTLDTLTSNGLDVFLKPHPNQSKDSAKIVEQLKSKYSSQPNVYWLSAKIANIALLKQSPRLVVSVYGSIIVESAYCNVRSISAGDHPAINCRLSYNPVDLSDYHHKLLNPELIAIPNQNDAISFLAQHTPDFSENHIPSLIQHLGLSFSELNQDSDILYSTSSKRFVSQSVDKLLSLHGF